MSSIQAAEDQSGNWAIVNMPKLDDVEGATNYANCGGASWAVSSNCKNTDLAFDFLKSHLQQMWSFMILFFLLPVQSQPTFRQQKVMHTHRKMNSSVAIRFYEKFANYGAEVPAITLGQYWEEAKSALGTALTQIQQGQDIQEALKEADDTVSFAMSE